VRRDASPALASLRAHAFAASLAAALTVLAAPAMAHDIPGELRVHGFVRPEGNRLVVLLRIPLDLLLNVDLPKRGPGYLVLSQIEPALDRAIAATDKDVALLEDGERLPLANGAGRISLPSDRSFRTFDGALALLRGPRLPEATDVFWNQGYFDALLEYGIRSPRSSFTIDFRVAPGLRDRLRMDLRYIAPGGAVRAYEFATGAGPIPLDPRWYHAAWSFVQAGFEHILGGIDHLLFLLCLILPFRRLDWYLAGVVTSFTIAHSVTLIAAAYGVVPSGSWFPPLVEVLIAASILYMALENVIKANVRRRSIVAGLFGLVHGFGFSFLLTSRLQFAGEHLLLSLVSFNVGVELGQLLVLLIALPALAVLYRLRPGNERLIAILVSAFVGHTAWHWLEKRIAALREADWPDALPWTGLAFVAIAAALSGAVVWLAVRQRRRTLPRPNA
jgi:hypothetical protein